MLGRLGGLKDGPQAPSGRVNVARNLQRGTLHDQMAASMGCLYDHFVIQGNNLLFFEKDTVTFLGNGVPSRTLPRRAIRATVRPDRATTTKIIWASKTTQYVGEISVKKFEKIVKIVQFENHVFFQTPEATYATGYTVASLLTRNPPVGVFCTVDQFILGNEPILSMTGRGMKPGRAERDLDDYSAQFRPHLHFVNACFMLFEIQNALFLRLFDSKIARKNGVALDGPKPMDEVTPDSLKKVDGWHAEERIMSIAEDTATRAVYMLTAGARLYVLTEELDGFSWVEVRVTRHVNIVDFFVFADIFLLADFQGAFWSGKISHESLKIPISEGWELIKNHMPGQPARTPLLAVAPTHNVSGESAPSQPAAQPTEVRPKSRAVLKVSRTEEIPGTTQKPPIKPRLSIKEAIRPGMKGVFKSVRDKPTPDGVLFGQKMPLTASKVFKPDFQVADTENVRATINQLIAPASPAPLAPVRRPSKSRTLLIRPVEPVPEVPEDCIQLFQPTLVPTDILRLDIPREAPAKVVLTKVRKRAIVVTNIGNLYSIDLKSSDPSPVRLYGDSQVFFLDVQVSTDSGVLYFSTCPRDEAVSLEFSQFSPLNRLRKLTRRRPDRLRRGHGVGDHPAHHRRPAADRSALFHQRLLHRRLQLPQATLPPRLLRPEKRSGTLPDHPPGAQNHRTQRLQASLGRR